MIRSLLAALPLAFGLSIAAADGPGTPPVRDLVKNYFGTEVHDPYRWMEDTKAPEVAAWMKSASDHAHATLARIPGRKALFDRLVKYDESVASRVFGVARETGDRWFFERRDAKDNQFKLFMRHGLQGRDKLLVDPEAIEKQTGAPHAINYFGASPGGAFVAYGLSRQGSEAAVLHVVDTRTGRSVGQPIDRADYAAVTWTADGRRMLFNRLQELKPGMPENEKYLKSQVLLLERGAEVGRARPVFGLGTPGVDIGPVDIPVVSLTSDGRWALGFAFNGVQREVSLFVSPAKALLAGRPQWQRRISAADQVTGISYHNDALYLLTYRGAPRSRVLRMPIGGAIAQAVEVVPASERVISGIAAAADALYVETRDGNVKRLYKRGFAADAPVVEVALPVQGSFQLNDGESLASAADPRFPGLVLDLQGWTRARQIYLVGADGRVKNTGLQPSGPFDAPEDVVATEVQVKSHDGALVPMSILHKKGVKLDGRNPTVLYGYASYGITEEPFFSTGRLAWLDNGGIVAVANPRGSGVYGQDWYKGGFQASKPNTWKDFIACAEWLVAQQWTSPARLGIMGGSAGGILVGRALTERPDLFAAAVPMVGALDMIHFEDSPNGITNVPEFGSTDNEPGFRALLAMSTYHQIRDGVRYPAVLLTHGVNDPRVEVWNSSKTAARLMAATASGKPVLLRLDYDAGHGIGSTKQQQLQERADVYAFLLWQLGVDGFQPQ